MKTNEVLGSPGKEEQPPSFGAKQSTRQVAGRGSRAGATLSIKGSVVVHFERVERMEIAILLNIYGELNVNLGETVIKIAIEFI